MKFVPMVTLSTWQWWKPPSSRVEHLQRLLLRADRGEALLRDRQRNLLVARAVQQQERTLHLLHDAVEPEAFELLHRLGAALDAEHPHQMLRRHRQRRHRAAVEQVEALLPGVVIVPLRAPGDAGGVARLERRRARRVIAAEADRHHADALGIDLLARPPDIRRPRCRISPSRRSAAGRGSARSRRCPARRRSGRRCRARRDQARP